MLFFVFGLPLLALLAVLFVSSSATRASRQRALYRTPWPPEPYPPRSGAAAAPKPRGPEGEGPGAPLAPAALQRPAAVLRASDSTFSEAVFLEWATLLFTRGQMARGGDVGVLSPWFADVQKALPAAIDGRPVQQVRGVVVGSARLVSAVVRSHHTTVTVAFRACLTTGGRLRDQAWYLEEQWTFRRALGVPSRMPNELEALVCRACGSPFERDPMGRCPHCQEPLRPGAHDWAVWDIGQRRAETRPPLLTGEVPEVGTSAPSVIAPGLKVARQAFARARPGFTWERFEARARTIFLELQKGWSEQRWEALRPSESENVFQSHRFWMEEYQRQGLRTRLDDVVLSRVEVVKVEVDACYEVVTCRVHASMRDSVVRLKDGAVVAGNPKVVRPFTEYWTFLRRPGVRERTGSDVECPSCGAALSVSQAGVCEYCLAKVTSGHFDWVLSRIEQDEEYVG
jgi:predicted lipid-binding transport protein (Tim44 family)